MRCDWTCRSGWLRSTGKTLLIVLVGIVFLDSPLPAYAQAQLSGRIVAPSGEGVANVTVSLTLATTQTAAASVRTDPNGEFVFENLAAGNYVLRVAAPGFWPTERRVTLNATDMLRLELPLALALEEAVTVWRQRALVPGHSLGHREPPRSESCQRRSTSCLNSS